MVRMNHLIHYDRLIERARVRSKPEGYVERHHVLPRSLGGTDDDSNLVWLTAREHFVAHQLLAHIYGGKMWYALWRMSLAKRLHSREYSWIRKAHSRAITGRTLSDETKKKMSLARTGKKRSRQAIEKNRAALMGHEVSLETRKKISASLAYTRRPIRQLSKGSVIAEFVSVREASRQTSISVNNLTNALKGRSKTAGGFEWEYL